MLRSGGGSISGLCSCPEQGGRGEASKLGGASTAHLCLEPGFQPHQRLSNEGAAGEGNGADGGAGRASGHCEEGMSHGDPGCWPCEEEGARQLLLGACPAVTCSGEGIEALPVAAGCRPENSTPLPEGHRASSQSRSCCLLHILAQEL